MIQVEEDIELRESLIRKGRERLKDFDRGLYFKNMENYFNSFRGEHDNLHEFIF